MPTGEFYPNKGWVCPKCNKVYAPHVNECNRCNNQHVNTVNIPGIYPDYVVTANIGPCDSCQYKAGWNGGNFDVNYGCKKPGSVICPKEVKTNTISQHPPIE